MFAARRYAKLRTVLYAIYFCLSVCLSVRLSVCLSVCTYLSVTVVTRIEMVKYVIKLFTTFLLRMKKALR